VPYGGIVTKGAKAVAMTAQSTLGNYAADTTPPAPDYILK